MIIDAVVFATIFALGFYAGATNRESDENNFQQLIELAKQSNQ